jgi:hypothetical protein
MMASDRREDDGVPRPDYLQTKKPGISQRERLVIASDMYLHLLHLDATFNKISATGVKFSLTPHRDSEISGRTL